MDNVFWFAIILTFFLIGIIWFVIANETKALEAEKAQAPSTTEPEAAPMQADPVDTTAWRVWGLLLIFGGVAGFGIALMMSTTVDAFGSAGVLAGRPAEIVNLGLLFNKGVAIAASLSAFGLGVFCFGVGAIVASLRARS